jgi:adenosylcobyric acid synthase
LLPVTTTLAREKRTRTVRATTPGGACFDAYEIHMGVTTAEGEAPAAPFATLDDGGTDGLRGDRALGTYLHGAFESAAVCAEVFGIEVPAEPQPAVHYRRLAAWLERHGRGLDRLGLGC